VVSPQAARVVGQSGLPTGCSADRRRSATSSVGPRCEVSLPGPHQSNRPAYPGDEPAGRQEVGWPDAAGRVGRHRHRGRRRRRGRLQRHHQQHEAIPQGPGHPDRVGVHRAEPTQVHAPTVDDQSTGRAVPTSQSGVHRGNPIGSGSSRSVSRPTRTTGWRLTHRLVIRGLKGVAPRPAEGPCWLHSAGRRRAHMGRQTVGGVLAAVSSSSVGRTLICLGLASSALGTRICSTPPPAVAWTASVITWAGRVIERRKSP
jgi:hypothetical protein